MHVASVRVYPVKSTRGLRVGQAAVERAGLAGDRRWAVIARGGHRLTARTHPRLLTVTATPDADGNLHLSAPGREPLGVDVPDGGGTIGVRFSRLDRVVDAGDAAADWFGDLLDEPVRLGWQDDPGRRPVNPDHGGLPGDPLSLADAGPLLLTTQASLDRLDQWLTEGGGAPIDLLTERMRPNVVVGGEVAPFAEDHWARVRIGAVDFRFADHCDRCVLTTVDPAGLGRGPEPIRTLARHRKWSGKTWFGIWLIPAGTGAIRAGDPVSVLGRR
ncbi:MAG: MOSC domain-containing protein [Nocardioidaceae bacterium]